MRAIKAVEAARERGGGVVSINGRRGAGHTSVLHTLHERFGEDARYVTVEQWVADMPLALFDRLIEVTAPKLHPTLFPRLTLVFQEAGNQLGADFVEAARLVLDEWAAIGQLVVLIDDVHQTDLASQQLLSYLARRLHNTEIVLVMTVTNPAPQLAPDLLSLLKNPECFRILVSPLEPAAIAQVAQAMGIHGLDPTGLTALFEHTGGWLDYVVQTLRELPGGQWPDEPGILPLPQQIIDEVMIPIDTCEQPDVRKLVSAMAIVETPPALNILQQIADTDDLMTAIDVAVERGILQGGVFREAYNTDQAQLAFTHPMAANVLLHQMLPSQQRKYHLRAAQFTDNHGARLLHLAAASVVRDPVLGGKLIRFADRLGRNGRWALSARFSFAAARLFSSDGQRQEQVLNGVDALASAGRVTTAVPWLPTVEAMPSSPARDAVLANVALHQGQAADVDRLLDQAHAKATQEDLQAMIALRRCLDMLFRWNAEGVVTWASRAAELSKSGEASQVEALAIRGVGLAAQGKSESADASIFQAAMANADGPQNQRFRLCAGWTAILEGDLSTAYRELEAALPTQDRGGSLRISLWAQAWLARIQFLIGDWSSALQGAQEGIRRAEHAGIEIMMPLLAWTVHEVLLWRGETPPAIYQSFGQSQMRGYLAMQVPARLIRGVECKVRNDQEGGIAALMPLVDTDPWTQDHASFWHWQPQLIHALIAADRINDAADLSRDYTKNTANAPRFIRATAIASAARLAAAQKNNNRSEELFLAALQLTSKDGISTYHGQYLFEYGQMLRRAGRRKDAAARLVSSREFFQGVNATLMVDRCNRELRATGMLQYRDGDDEAPVTEAASIDNMPVELTPQEHAITQLVIQGLTNREAARNLFIAEKTVQYHLTRIYAKFGIRSRTELARVYGDGDSAGGADSTNRTPDVDRW